MSAEQATWGLVPYRDSTPFKRVRVRDEVRIRAILRHIQAHECVALIGPPFSEKSDLLQDVVAELREIGHYRPLYLDLWLASSQDEAAFYKSMIWLIQSALDLPAAPPLDGGTPNARTFQNYVIACLEAQPDHLVLLIDHLQALPHDLVHSLLVALRAAYMERAVDAPNQMVAVVTGGMNLVGLSAGSTSPFNIAKPVLALPLTPEQSLALAEATVQAHGFAASSSALERVVEWAGGDRYLVPQISTMAAESVRDSRRALVDRRAVDRAARTLFMSGERQAPIREAIRMIEEDPDTLLDVLQVLRDGSLLRSKAHQMPTRTGADRLQLSGAVTLAQGQYHLKNMAYRNVLGQHFTIERVGHILRIAGRWQEAIAYLAPQLSAEGGQDVQSQLLEATVQSIYATDALARAWELLARGIHQGFNLPEVAVYRAIPARGTLELVYPQGQGTARPPAIPLKDGESVEARTYEFGNYAVRGSAGEARLVAALQSQGRRIGVVTVDHYIEGRDPHELPADLPELLHFLRHAASAVENVMIRAAYREIGQAVLDASTVQPTLHRVLEAVSEALNCDAANLYLLNAARGEVRMVAGVGELWSPEWQSLACYPQTGSHPAAIALHDGRMRTVSGTDERLVRAITDRFGLHRYTWLYLPLQAAGRPLGTLELGYSEINRIAPNQENRATLSAFANQVAIAVHNAQLLRRTDEALARRVDELEKLRSSSLAIGATLDVDRVLARIVEDLRALFPGTETTLWEYSATARQLTVLHSSLSDEAYRAQRLDLDSCTGRAVATGEVQIVSRLDQLPNAAHDPAVILGLRGLIAVPLLSHNRVLGAIDLYSYSTEPGEIQAGEADLLRAFAAHAAVAIENARLYAEEAKRQRLEQELAVAQDIQRSLLPAACPQADGWQFAANYRAARVVGGDFYDFFDLEDVPERVGLVIADVTDKGMPAALFMALSRTLIRSIAHGGLSPAAVMTGANKLILKDNRSDMYLTAIYGVLEMASGEFVYANAGHNRPLWYQAATSQIVELGARGVLLGAFDEIALDEESVSLLPGDVLLFYTDGVTDAMNADGTAFGDEQLAAVLAARAREGAAEILGAVMQAVTDFAGDTEQADDITCLVIKRV